MKPFPLTGLLLFLFFLPISLFSQEIPASQLVIIVEDGDSLAYDSLNRYEPYYGFVVERYPDGAVMRKTFYQKGRYKKITDYHPNGKVRSEGNFKRNGNEAGNYIEYDIEGRVMARGKYRYGERTGLWEFFENGKRVTIGNYHSGMKHGTWKYLDEKGAVKETKVFFNDVEKTQQ